MTTPWVLAVDFGTTNTVASVADATSMRTLTINGRPVMPSAVLLNRDGSWTVGDAAVRFAQGQRGWFDPCPKYGVRDSHLFLGGDNVPVTAAITALLRPIVEEAARQHGDTAPAVFVVTHPATWRAGRVGLLVESARAATAQMSGWPDPLPVAEPVAAAQRVLDLDSVPARARIVVLDLGGGTVDVSVVDRDGDQLTVVGRPSGIDDLGGEDFDLRLADWMTAEAGAPGLYTKLAQSPDPDQNELANDIRGHARAVKEQLSRQTVVQAHLPKSPPDLPGSTPVQVTKATLEDLVRGGPGREQGLTEAVDLVERALADAPPGPPFAGVFLAGGGARIPLLGSLVSARTARVPIDHGDPTTAVADGAARFALAQVGKQVVPEQRGEQAEQTRRSKIGGIVVASLLVTTAVAGGVWAAVSPNDPPCGSAQTSRQQVAGCTTSSGPISTTTTTPIIHTEPPVNLTEMLIARVPSDLATRCKPHAATDDVRDGLLAAVSCTPTGSPDALYFYKYSSMSAMDSAFATWTGSPTGTDCAAGDSTKTYTVNNVTTGRYACYFSDAKKSVLTWTDEPLNILGVCIDASLTRVEMADWFLKSPNLN